MTIVVTLTKHAAEGTMGSDPSPIIYSTIALQYLAVMLGITWWRAATIGRFWGNMYLGLPFVGLFSVLLLVVAAYRSQVKWRPTADARLTFMIARIAGYAVLVILLDPFLWIEDRVEDALLVAVILPPLLWLKPLVRSRAWLAVCGVVLFSAASIACILINGTIRGWGVGFFSRWVQ
jgi:hypothetical protein